MSFILNILYVFLFIFCLSVLVVVHELGHLSMAKAFKVYCLEFSVGFGPTIFSRKRKGGETTFSLRSIPFGGYVSMYGEGVELPEGTQIPESRSLTGVKKWKRAIILVAGVVMNAILAIVLFFVSEFAFVQKGLYINAITVNESSIASTAGLKTGDIVDFLDELHYEEIKNSNLKNDVSYIHVVDDDMTITYSDSTTKKGAYIWYIKGLTDYNHLSISNYSYFFEKDDDNINWDRQIVNYSGITSFDVTLKTHNGETTNAPINLSIPVIIRDTKYVLEDIGMSFYLFSYRNNFVESLKLTFEDFGESSTAIIKTFGSLFTSQEVRDSVGGIIAIGFETTSVLQNFGLGKFIYLWGMISVNLAIVNLFPFPGLDGWQLLVLFVEAVAHKEIPNKVKNIVSFVGIALVFILMLVLVFKDVFTYII